MTTVLKDVEVLGLYEVIRMSEYDPMLCLLAFRPSQELDWSRYGSSSPLFLSHELTTGLLYGIPPFRANKRSKTGSVSIADTPGHEASWLQDIQFASSTSFEAEWAEYGGATGSGGGPEVAVVEPPVLHDLNLLFERDAGRTKDAGAAKPRLQKEWRLLMDELPGLQMAVPTDSLGIVNFECEVVKKNKFLVKEVEAS